MKLILSLFTLAIADRLDNLAKDVNLNKLNSYANAQTEYRLNLIYSANGKMKMRLISTICHCGMNDDESREWIRQNWMDEIT